MREMVEIVLAVAAVVFVVGFSRALSVKMATGKWPHQDKRAAEIFREMP